MRNSGLERVDVLLSIETFSSVFPLPSRWKYVSSIVYIVCYFLTTWDTIQYCQHHTLVNVCLQDAFLSRTSCLIFCRPSISAHISVHCDGVDVYTMLTTSPTVRSTVWILVFVHCFKPEFAEFAPTQTHVEINCCHSTVCPYILSLI